jgi:mono/diheme cytochrome c family protein
MIDARQLLLTIIISLVGAFAMVPRPASANDPSDETDIFSIARGGLLYDKWYAVLERDAPANRHPSYPADGKQKGGSTWRCKECHGWDYKGAAGAYSKGSHFTGIKGVRGAEGKDPAEIVVIIRNKTHAYTTEMMSDKAVRRLALFLTKGQIDMDKYIDRVSRKAKGDAQRGARFYQTICAICHGFDGKQINFKDEKGPEFIGTVAQANPWETLHKIRNGQPGVPMVALTALSIADQVDILAYTQTLPTK